MEPRHVKTTLLAALAALALAGPIRAQATDEAPAPAEQTAARYDFPAKGTTRVIDEKEVSSIIANHGSELLVVNFWATWCGPCVEELPYFVQLSKDYDEKAVRIVGFSVDLKKDVETKVVPFLVEREIPYANVVLFVDQEEIINSMSKEWGGEVPATFFFNAKGENVGQFLGQVEYEELKEKTDSLLAAERGKAATKEPAAAGSGE
jgi:thiol-disulfide isomerase/thioredoxin